MAGKIAWIMFGIAMICAIIAAFTSPFRLEVVTITCAAVSILLGLFGMFFAFESWREELILPN